MCSSYTFLECVRTQGAFVEGVLLDSGQLARAAVDIASDKKASDVILLDIRDVTTIADYFVICSGNSHRQIQAIADAIEEQLKEREYYRLERLWSEAKTVVYLQ